jgi:hypothetical protein
MQKKSENFFLRYRARSSRWAFVIATGLESSAPTTFRTASQNLQGPLCDD